MNLNLKGFSQLVQDMSATLQGSASALVDVSVGSVLRAIFEANASVALWLQWLILQVLRTTRAASSAGADLDTWMNDFGLNRLPATAAVGVVSFSRYANNLAASIAAGTIVKSTDGSLSFTVTADTSLSIWQPSSSTYQLPIGVNSATLPVACMTAGAVGNVLAGAITIIASSLPGIDLVTNAVALMNGSDAESDDAFRARFQGYLSSLSRATLLAVQTAVTSVQQNLSFVTEENVAADGSPAPGSFLVVVDDGTGSPPDSLLALVSLAVDRVRPIGTTFSVVGPGVLTVNVQLSVQISPSAFTNGTSSAVQQAIVSYLNGLPIGVTASATRVAQQAYSVDPGISNVMGVTLNGQAGDVLPPARTAIKAGQVTVTINAG